MSQYARDPEVYRRLYGDVANANPMWGRIAGATGPGLQLADVDVHREAAVLRRLHDEARPRTTDINGARALGIFGDSITTDHISPAGAIKENSPAGKWLVEHGVTKADFNSYGSRRGNHEVMMRGTFANVRIKNLMIPPRADGTREEGGVTLFQPSGEKMFIYDAAMKYIAQGTPTVVFGGEEYGTGSSRDWAAKGTQLLGVKAVDREELRAHPPLATWSAWACCRCSSRARDSAQTLGITGEETFDIVVPKDIRPQQDLTLVIHRKDGTQQEVPVLCRIDTPIEVDYYNGGGILPVRAAGAGRRVTRHRSA